MHNPQDSSISHARPVPPLSPSSNPNTLATSPCDASVNDPYSTRASRSLPGAACDEPSSVQPWTGASTPRRHSTGITTPWTRPIRRLTRPVLSITPSHSASTAQSGTSEGSSIFDHQHRHPHREDHEFHFQTNVANSQHPETPGKRQQSQQDSKAGVTMEPTSFKKARTGSSPPRRFGISAAASSSPASSARPDGPLSPLFFSHTPSRPSRQSTGSGSDARTSMLPRTAEEPVTIVKLPHASVKTRGSAMSSGTPGSLNSSMDMSAPALSPDMQTLPPSLQLVNSIGTLELVEQDDRPTFLVDLLSSNRTPSNQPTLHLLYCNDALRSSHELIRLVGTEADDIRDHVNYEHFVSWATSSASLWGGEDPAPTSYVFGGIAWSCTTLRQRFRFVHGNASTANSALASASRRSSSSTAPLKSEHAPPDASTGSARAHHMPVTPVVDTIDPALDAPDYFGDVVPGEPDVEPSIEAIQSKFDVTHIPLQHPDEFTNQVLQLQPIKQSFDWTRLPFGDDLPAHINFAKSRDWASTALGPMEDWPPDLRTMSSLVMATPHPAALYWGPDTVTIYNESYISLAGKKHPLLMGMRYDDAWAEIWSEIQPIFDSAWNSGESTMKHDNQLFINRDGFLEETFFSWAIVPLIGSEGEVVGLYNPCFENTRRKVNERRMHTLREIGEKVATASSVTKFWPQLQAGLEYNEYDMPFTIIYSVKEDTESEGSSLHSNSLLQSSQMVLEGSLGVPSGHKAAPPTIDLKSSEDGFAPYMRQSMSMGGAPVVLSEREGTLPKHLLHGIEWGGFGDPSSVVVIFPVIPTTTKEAVAGFIVMGTNPRRPYDEDYQLFVQLLSRQLATSMASVVLFEEEIRRGQRAARLAALDRQELSMQLLQRTQEASESEYRFTRMAEFAPVGMFIADGQGTINYCNDMWWQISRHTRIQDAESGWMDSVRAEDRPALEEAWGRLIKEKTTISLEFRFKCSQQSGDNTIDTWVLMSAFPEKTVDGALKSIFGCITDISSQKWAEKVQSERRKEAVELKRQQENFIDITSHEMRNPLSAILQCADQIVSDISDFSASSRDQQEVENLLEGCLDSANTINLCASHQKRIVNDILTLSKLDSSLLAVTPGDVQPVKVVQSALKMFEPELTAHDIDFECRVDGSFERYGVSWAKLDPSRLSQVLINLMTNAIKFTQGRERRSITVHLSASRDISEVSETGVSYFDRSETQRASNMDIDNEAEWGSGEVINVHCTVEDTGPGLAEEEMKLLFQRFQQATPRTHVQYGGSGLGLFISRILTEMQGGQIGVSSKRGEGSRFSFYIQCRKCADPPTKQEHVPHSKLGRKAALSTSSPGSASKSPDNALSRVSSSSGNSRSLFDVLIVEDNIVNQKVLQRQLRHCGNNTFVANHGFEALQTLQKSRFWAGQEQDGVDISVILMDLEMPVMDGMTCAKRIRELEREGTIVTHIPIIAVTAYARPEQIEDAKAAGIDDVISKPFRIPELMPRIEELVTKYRNLTISASA